MAVAPKKRKSGTTYYVVTWANGKAYWERSGTDKREAERLDARRKREVEAGTFQATEVVKSVTVETYASQWGDGRTNVSSKDDKRNLARFTALPEFASLHIDDVRPRHIISALGKLKSTVALKTLKNAYGTLRTMFRDARIAELVGTDPCVLPRGFFDDGSATEREPYERSEAAVLVAHLSIPEPIRVLNALCLLGGLREGEACGRRWRDLDQGPAPLWALEVRDQYGGREGKGERDRGHLKTKKTRLVPVHPELAQLLERWAKGGFIDLMGRPPTPEDFIVPYPSPRVKGGHHTRSTYYKAFVASCKAAGIRCRSLHSTRHTMITLARRGGARKDVLSKVTHNAKGDIVDRYTHLDWEPLCEAVLCIGSLFGARQSAQGTRDLPGNSGSGYGGKGAQIPVEYFRGTKSRRLQFPAPPLALQQKTSGSAETRQSSRQREWAEPDENRRAAGSYRPALALALAAAELTLGVSGQALVIRRRRRTREAS